MSGDEKAPRPLVARPIPMVRQAAPRPAVPARPAPAPPPRPVAQAVAPAVEPGKSRAPKPDRPATELPSATAPTLDDVRACYRLLLGREPEDEGVLQRHRDQSRTRMDLVNRFLDSDEFRAKGRFARKPGAAFAIRRQAIELEATPAQLSAMLARTGEYWAEAGREMPHWSVLTQDQFRPDEIAANIDAFYATGCGDAQLLESLLTRHGILPESLRHAVEFGCGVGRATLWLARLFDRVTGCDISRPHLDLAVEQAAARIVDNVAWHHSTIDSPMPPAGPGGGWDFWFSRIVLQHNPPPVAAHLLRMAFAGLRPGGVVVFQVLTDCHGYSFSIDAYLARSEPPAMELHVLPQAAVFALAREAGLEVLEVRPDDVAEAGNTAWVSEMFVLRRPAAPVAGG